MHFDTETGKIEAMKASIHLLARQPVGLSLRAPHLRDLLAAAIPENVEELAAELAAQRKAIQSAGRSTEDITWPNPLA